MMACAGISTHLILDIMISGSGLHKVNFICMTLVLEVLVRNKHGRKRESWHHVLALRLLSKHTLQQSNLLCFH